VETGRGANGDNVFYTLKFAKRLKAAGLPEAEAEAISEALLKSDLQRDIKELKQRMTIKLGTIMVIGIGVIAAIIKLA